MNATTEWLRNWWPEAARSAVTSNPDVARNELGSDGVAELKRSVSDLVSRANEIVREHLDNKAAWPHRGGIDPLDITRMGSRSRRRAKNGVARTGRYSRRFAVGEGNDDNRRLWERRQARARVDQSSPSLISTAFSRS